MWTLEESLHGSFMILLGFIVIVIARKIAFYFRKDDIDLTKMNDIHSWSELDALLKVKKHFFSFSLNPSNFLIVFSFGRRTHAVLVKTV